MRKGLKRKVRVVRAPAMVALLNAPEVEIAERMALESFLSGWADRDSFDVLVECHTMLAFGAADKQDVDALAVIQAGSIALANIRDRHANTNTFGVSGDERSALALMVDYSQGWWRRQGGGLYERCYHNTRHWHGMSAAQRKESQMGVIHV